MHYTTLAAFLVAFAAGASAHMEVVDPPVFRGRTNPFAKKANDIDFDMVAPLKPDGFDFPCKGYDKALGTDTGASTKVYTAGQQATFKTEGNEAAHNGGSCQVSLSFDQGKTWKVIKSFIGNCVRSAGGNVFDANQEYSFTIPAEAKSGDALWAWTWFNQTGNREMYMNCAHITIKGSGTSTLDDHPDMFVANVNKGCKTTEDTDVDFPNPGKDVERNPAKNGKPTAAPVCEKGTGAPVPASPGAGGPPDQGKGVPATPEPSGELPSGELPSPGEDASAPPAKGLTHTVAPGEFCFSIARDNRISLSALLKANPDIDPNCTTLKVGQVLNLRRRSRVMRAIA